MKVRRARWASSAGQLAIFFVTALISTPIIADGSDAPRGGPLAIPGREEEFLRIQPLPEGIENVSPIPGAVNVLFAACEASWPEGYRSFRAEDFAVEGHARRRDIYAWLRARQAFEMKDCGCTGKVAPWEPVKAVYAALQEAHGDVLIRHTAEYDAQANILTALVERMCGGRF